MKFSLSLLVIIGLGYGANYFQQDLYSLSSYQGSYESLNLPEDNTLRLIGIMAQFSTEVPDNPKTSGNGQFLSENSANYINFFGSETSRCDGFLVDRPPHNSAYFQAQLKAVGNYYEDVSDSNLIYTAEIISNPNSPGNGYYTVSHEMEYYAKGDARLAEFFSEALDLAISDMDAYFEGKEFTPDDVVFIVFHAGLSQDYSYPSLDPTIYDLKSAYIDEDMMLGVSPAVISGEAINTGILLPESQNMIYYDVVEDIFGNPDYDTDDLCDIQVGMTGLFAMLLGYELGLPPMFNTDTGDLGVGRFGLMDYGSNNGRGVIPVAPTPWTRIKVGWSEEININSFENSDSILIKVYDMMDIIHRIDIAEDEYFLIENRNIWILPGIDIDSLRRKHKIDENKLGNWFDVITDSSEILVENHLIQIDETTSVITGFDHYDYGLPGSGILIWHIKEPSEALYSSGINNDKYNRHVQIEEADGAVDIGFNSHAFFASDAELIAKGWLYDYWYNDNYYYSHYGNPNADVVVFNNTSNPNTRTTDGAESFLSITILSEISDSMYIRVMMDDGIEIVNLSNEPVHYLGNVVDEDTAFVFYGKDDNIYRHSLEYGAVGIDEFNPEEDKFIFTYDRNTFEVRQNQNFWFDMDGTPNHDEYKAPMGYILDDDILDIADISLVSSDTSLAFGDIDLDGLDEILFIKDDSLFAFNANNTKVNGFPIAGEFTGIPLIANIISIEDDTPEIICRENDDIVIISNEGDRLRQLSSMDVDQPLAMVPYWNSNNMALIDGSRLFLFALDMDHSYWLNHRGRSSGLPYPLSTSLHSLTSNQNFGRQQAYNYPNPITEGRTTFRFFVESSSGNIKVRIYDAAGFLVKDNLELTNPTVNEFNEIEWENIQVDAGLYLAEIKRDVGTSELVRLVVIK